MRTIPWYRRWWYNFVRPYHTCRRCGDVDSLTQAFGGLCFGCAWLSHATVKAEEAQRVNAKREPKRLLSLPSAQSATEE